jgi:phosphate uptake regulator
MEYRKLISFGKSSFVVSLPKAWIKQNKLQKGDLIYIEESSTSLLLQPRHSKKEREEKSIRISVDGKSIRHIKREIISAYVCNNSTITLVGNEIKNRSQEITPIIQGLMAVEVMEQTSKEIVARDFLNIGGVSTNTIIRKMDVIIRSMMEDCEQSFDVNSSESINYRDNDVNKLAFLMFRIVRYGLENPSYMVRKFDLDSLALANLWWLSFDLESLADEIKRVSRYMERIELDKEQQEAFKGVLRKVKKYYLDMMKAYYDKNVEAVHNVVNQKEEMIDICNEFYENFYVQQHTKKSKSRWLGFLTDRTRAAIGHINHIGRVLYQ